jgi:putative tryptophan/tyrosine transport system substrate-binding protein
MRRREFISFIGSAAAAWPLVARAQQPTPVVGFLNSGLSAGYAVATNGFKQGLKDSGYVEGQNVAIEYRGQKANMNDCRRSLLTLSPAKWR